jgi:hypothetical protein
MMLDSEVPLSGSLNTGQWLRCLDAALKPQHTIADMWLLLFAPASLPPT